ncbi:DUF2179 domain-containing protein [Acetobacterium tundrae]|uniref:UPF0316 protein GH807_13670 n=1 Tax=Acetobacterium tundrae TaxID=132932 RepID=A0ABR6WNR2_9FIRM|nr:DUF2179 domain-containing protein [Acetobacterium tundrae]MBC3798089.1 DUF2179 domain-containing protein [Acetobacterium tundrae]
MLELLLIIFIQLLYVPMLTLRTICMVKNLKILTAIFGFLETLVYIFGLTIVLSGERNIVEMIVYAFGFALGLVVGILVEEKLAIGFASMQVNITHDNEVLVNILRDEGFGVTVYLGEGKYGKRINLDILTKRKKEAKLLGIIHEYEPEAFIMAFEPKMFRGGYLTEMMKKRLKPNKRNINQDENKLKCIIKRTVDGINFEATELKKNWMRNK